MRSGLESPPGDLGILPEPLPEGFDFIRASLVAVFDQIWVSFVGFYFRAEPAPGRWRKPHDGKQGFGRKFFSMCFEQRSEIIAALLLFCQSCLESVAVNSPWFIISGFLSDVDLRTVSS